MPPWVRAIILVVPISMTGILLLGAWGPVYEPAAPHVQRHRGMGEVRTRGGRPAPNGPAGRFEGSAPLRSLHVGVLDASRERDAERCGELGWSCWTACGRT